MRLRLYISLLLITMFSFSSNGNIANHLAPGGIAAVYREGNPVYIRVNGFSDIKKKIPVSEHTRFYFGSDGKKFTSFCITQLVSLGKIRFSDAIGNYISGLPDHMKDITIDHLLYHTSGIRDYLSVINIMCRPKDESLFENEKIFALIRKQSALNFEPGAMFCYSNSNYFLLAMIVEKVTAMAFSEYVRQMILLPAGMKETRFRHEERTFNDAYGYSKGKKGYKKDENENAAHKGDGGIVSSSGDMDKFYRFLFSEKNNAILKLMQQPAIISGRPYYYRRGLMTDTLHGESIWYHGGGFRGFTSQMIYIPSKKMSVITAVNFSGVDALKAAYQLADSILRKDPPDCMVDNKAIIPQKIAGWYIDSLHSDFRSFQVKDRILYTNGNIKLDNRSGNNFISSCIPIIEYDFDTAGGVVVRKTSTITSRMKKIEPCSFDPSFAGTYVSEEANDTKAEVEIERNGPVFYYNRRYLARVSVSFGESCILHTFDAVIRFGRNDKGEEGFWLSNDRVFDLWFRKKS